ncbi:hypothetical protein SIID45300_02981 [Candidatus Magnetaquicoccaceae bacterium FCR-1]|uniref:DUF302 domain-containing protein n=1 Tax=Candidatus Magnetaquiglobus chichijimensis TaxID=3141448 RepID=A0ABQ0CCN5_9PROT
MGMIKNLLAVLGLMALLGGGYGYAKLAPKLSQMDPGYMGMYTEFASRLLETLDPGLAMVWSVPVENPDLTPNDIKESLKSLASAKDFLFVGEAPFYKQVEAVTGQPYRHVEFLSFCDAKVGKMMADYQDAYTAFMPCRIALVRDKQGKLWLYSMNLDMMIHGGKTLPPELRKEALRVRNVIKDLMIQAAKGEF